MAPLAATKSNYDGSRRWHWIGLVAVTVAAGLVRAYRLDSPRTPIYDESYMGVIVHHYKHGEWFFDLHPPLARLLHYYVAVVLLGAPDCAYNKDMAWVECDMWQMRSVPCALGTLLVPLFYGAARQHGASRGAALAGASLVACEPMFFALSRVHLLDMVALACVALVVNLHARLLRCVSDSTSTTPYQGAPDLGAPKQDSSSSSEASSSATRGEEEFNSSSYLWRWLQMLALLALDGVALGCALASKFGVALPTAIWCAACLVLACVDAGRRGATPLGAAATQSEVCWFAAALVVGLAVITCATYIGLLVWHFSLLPLKPKEEGSYAAFALTKKHLAAESSSSNGSGSSSSSLSWLDGLAEQLLLSLNYDCSDASNDLSCSVWARMAEFTMEQLYYYLLLDRYELNVPRLPNSHPSHGPLWGWPVAYRGVLHGLFTQQKAGLSDDCSGVYFLPSPLICWLATLAVGTAVLKATSRIPSEAWCWWQSSWGTSMASRETSSRNGGNHSSNSNSSSTSRNSESRSSTDGIAVDSKKSHDRIAEQSSSRGGTWGLGPGALALGYCLHMLPYATVHRELFVIYYALPYFFALLALTLSLDSIAYQGNVSACSGVAWQQQQQQQGPWWRNLRTAFGRTRAPLYLVPLLGLLTFVYMRPLVTGSLPPSEYLARLASATPACYVNQCFNAPPGTPLRAALDSAGGDERRGVFPVLLGKV